MQNPFFIYQNNFKQTVFEHVCLLSLSFFLGAILFIVPRSYAVEINEQVNVDSYNLIGHVLNIKTAAGTVSLTAYDDEAIEVVYTKIGVQHLPSFSIASETKKHTSHVVNTSKKITFSTGKLTAVIHKSPLQLSFYKNDKLLIAEKQSYFSNHYFLNHDPLSGDSLTDNEIEQTSRDNPSVSFKFALNENEKLLGGGERILGMNRRGHAMPLYNKAHYGYSTESNQMYFGLPAVMSSEKYILLFDNPAKGSMDIGKKSANVLAFNAVGGRSSYLVFSGDSYPKLIENYVQVTGKQPLPARWTLGSFASRFGYRNEQEVRDVVAKYKQEDFPLDALVLDLYWFGKDIKGHMGNLDWDKKAFPTPEKMIADLKKQGVKTIAITEPFVLSNSSKWLSAVEAKALALDENKQAKQFDFYFGNTGLVDVFNQKGRDWFNQSYQMLFNQGIAGWWGDLGEPEVHPSSTKHLFDNGMSVTADDIHNVYGHRWAEMVYNKQLTMAPEQRPFVMMRSGFAGSQRYGMMPWTGDVSRSWGGLQSQVELSLQMSVFGLAYTHSDLGGFAGGEAFNAELYTRWLQYGVFQPVFRPHGQDNIAPEPIYHDKKTKDILRKYLKLRYQLLPYNYTLAYQNHLTGMPLMRPLFFENENDLSLIDNKTSYLWGDVFYVTPIIDADVKTISVTLPKGVWFDYWNGNQYQGNQVVELPVTLENIPVLVKAGAFIPMVGSVQSTKNYSSKSLTLHYYADKSVSYSKGEMYEDDGTTHQALEKNLFELLKFSAKRKTNNNGMLTFNFSKTGGGYAEMPMARNMTLVIHHWAGMPKQVKLNDRVLSSENAEWDPIEKTLMVKFMWQQQALTLTIM